MKYLLKIYAIIFLSIIAAIIYMYFSLEKTKTELTSNINTLFISQAKEVSNNIKHIIQGHNHQNLYKTLQNNLAHKKHFEEVLSVLTTDTFKYVYILYRDKKGNYRFLADGSKKDRGEFDEKLNVDTKAWDKTYTTQQPQLLYQSHLNGLWMSYLNPVVMDNKTQAIIAIDFSTRVPQNIASAMKPLHNIFLYIFIAILSMLLILLYQTYLNFRTKKDSITDQLTQAYNRVYLRDLLKNINIAHYQIIMLDIDHFKSVNDTYGHNIGDFILKDIAKIVHQEIRSNDIFVRFGGEEFLIFIHNKTNEAKLARKIAQRIRKKVQDTTFTYEDLSIKTTLSIGVNTFPDRFKNISDAIKYADEMLYIAKKTGRNKVISKSKKNQSIQKQIKDKLHINDIKGAIEDGLIVCQFQAIFDAKTEKISKYEALVRLKNRHNDSLIYPNDFLPQIMHTSIYTQMTKAILDIVFQKIKEYKINISINLNFSDILDDSIYSIILDEIQQNKEFASWLIIELLEYEKIEIDASFRKKIKKLKSYGVKIAIDDFGTGFANYSVFEAIDIDIIKIDASLIKNIDNSSTAKNIVASIVSLTNKLNITTVAEFVHSKAVLDITKTLGVTDCQGFYLAKPENEILFTVSKH
ncbi:EAL domain-containing protein [Sulfurimonas sp.]